ncbi:AAA family ATPase [Lactobacillus johnsonii 16]|uniref:AAA family ATPase n=1 Tax=Lactobacillus johnsonii TaxID=33959 RepID=UPI00069FB4B3|nr:AAA family ATPase [Lactobacillus johnsonii]KOH01444.1 AAA family ATPase [Lactobacillus johnsonii 16]
MTFFVVGPDDRGFFKKQRTTWEFEDALNQASDGDNILIKRDYQFPLEDQNYVINKSLNISGEDNTFILGGFIIKNGAQVKLNNLTLRHYQDKNNCLQVTNNSQLIATHVSVVNDATTGQNYPIIYVDDGATAQFDDLYVEKDKLGDGAHRIYVEKGNVEIKNSTLNCKITATEANLTLQNTTLSYGESNVLSLYSNTVATLQNVTVTGGVKEKDYPCIFSSESILNITSSIIKEPNYSGALYLQKAAQAKVENSIIDSLYLYNQSKIDVGNTSRIVESIIIEDHSALTGETLLLDGRDNGKINIFSKGESNIKLDWIGLAFESSPNIKIEDNVTFNVPEVYVLKFDSTNDEYDLDENNQYTIVKDNLQNDIEYFTTQKKESNSKQANKAEKDQKDLQKGPQKSGMQQLDEMIGLETVKQQVKEFIAVTVLNKKREEKGLNTSSQTLHSLFLGNPETGKTTVARIVGHVLYEKGVIAEDKLIETSRADLVAGYVGQTAEKTRKVLESALDGILFVDEAYTLASGGQNDFGKEAIDEILKFMEDHRSNIMIIFAGYTNDMEKFLETNPGLRSRIPNKFDFEDYTVDEMVQIGLFSLKKQQYHVNPSSYADLLKNNLSKDNDNSNGRWVRNLNDKIIKKQAVRVALTDSYSEEDLINITDADLDAVRL